MLLMLSFYCVSYGLQNRSIMFLMINTMYNAIIIRYNFLYYFFWLQYFHILVFLLFAYISADWRVEDLSSSFSCIQVTTVLVIIIQVLYWCLNCILKLFFTFTSVLFHCKLIIFIHFQSVTLYYGCLIITTNKDLPHILPYNIMTVCWVSKP